MRNLEEGMEERKGVRGEDLINRSLLVRWRHESSEWILLHP